MRGFGPACSFCVLSARGLVLPWAGVGTARRREGHYCLRLGHTASMQFQHREDR